MSKAKSLRRGGSPGKGREISGAEPAKFMRIVPPTAVMKESSIFDNDSVMDLKQSGIIEILHDEMYFQRVM